MRAQIFYVDTFTDKAFTGNPTSVCCSHNRLDNTAMQTIAAELNLPVSAFVFKKDQPGSFDIRYFTPITEIPACGHATLASARVMMELESLSKIVFHTGQGLAIETMVQNGAIMMCYPTYEWKKSEVAAETLHSLGIDAHSNAAYSAELETMFIELNDPNLLKNIQPHFKRLTASSNTIKEVVITTVSDDARYDYLLRSFCPWIGIDEDPVTGSVHSVLGPFWQRHLQKNRLTAYQASARGGVLLVNTFDNRVEIGGHSVVIMKGEMDC